ncbi:MAG TPA: topoisomerase C-terminal repeat-containing protein, partial [Xanthomonadales bacterium]|nr:topoisomerase C-terminal repeat-containing protein [Xanthomonadales bacterium]
QFEGTDIQVLRGRYGPYITDGAKNARMPKDREPESLTQRECEELLAAAPERKRGRKKAVRKKAATRAGSGRKKAARSADSEPAPATPSD